MRLVSVFIISVVVFRGNMEVLSKHSNAHIGTQKQLENVINRETTSAFALHYHCEYR